MNFFDQFYRSLPVRRLSNDDDLHLLNGAERRHLQFSRFGLMTLAALLSVAGFLIYYLPAYWAPQLFPSASIAIPGFATPLRLPWAVMLWCVLLATIEVLLLTFVNIAGVHEVAVAMGITSADAKSKSPDLLYIGLEKKSTEVTRYGIDPFEGVNRWILIYFNTMLRLKGWIGNQIIRYLVRTLLGRYAVRTVLDFAGMPLYMLINAYSVHAVMREAQVTIMGRTVISLFVKRLPRLPLTESEQVLLYDTLQYIAVSKRDFHQNHFLLTKELLEYFRIPARLVHRLSPDYFAKLANARAEVKSLCQIVILLGFILDGRLSWRERRKLRQLNAAGIQTESHAEIRDHLRNFMQGRGVESLIRPYLPVVTDED